MPGERTADRRFRGPPPAALLTDVWFTLVYYPTADRERIESARRRTWLRALTRAGISRVRAREVVWRVEQEVRAFERIGRTPSLATRIRTLAKAEGVSLPSGRMVAAFDRLVEDDPPRVAPGARTALRALRSQGFRLGVVSNVTLESGGGARRLLDLLRLRPLFDTVVLSTDRGYAKPDPRLFLRALRRLGVEPSRAWYVGDLPTDVEGATAAGMHPIRFVGLERYAPTVPTRWPTPAPVLRRWSDLPEWLRGQRGAP